MRDLPEPAAREMRSMRTSRWTFIGLYGVDAFGAGSFASVQILFFISVLERSAAEVSVALTVAGLVGMSLLLPFGRFVDHRDRRIVVAVLSASFALALAAYFLPQGGLTFIVITGTVVVLQKLTGPARAALLAQTFPHTKVRVRALVYVAYNVGFSVGSLLGAWAAASGENWTYFVVLGVNIGSVAVCSVLVLTLPRRSASDDRAVRVKGFAVLRDRPFLMANLVNLFGSLHDAALFIGMPLWLIERTDAPHWAVPAITVANCVLVVAIQVPLTRGTEDQVGALKAQWRGAVLAAIGCVLLAFVGSSVTGFIVVIVVSVLLLTVGEVLQSAGAWGVSFSLAPEDRLTEYQSVFGLSQYGQEALGPVLVTALVIGLPPQIGWIMLAAIILLPVTLGTWLLLRTGSSFRVPMTGRKT